VRRPVRRAALREHNLDEAVRDGRLIRSLPSKALHQMPMSVLVTGAHLQHADAIGAIEVAKRLWISLVVPARGSAAQRAAACTYSMSNSDSGCGRLYLLSKVNRPVPGER
jgi:hypothetical protein